MIPDPVGLNWSQELRLMFTRRAMGLPADPWEVPTRMILNGHRSPSPDIDRFILNEYAAWQRDCRNETT